MCGIAGILEFGQDRRVEPEILRRMCQQIIHRGPDDEGYYVQDGVGLGMRRLSVIDLFTGHQPLSNETRTIWIVFNGEIYNYPALREQLVARGHRFETRSDTEVIVHLYEEHGHDCVQHLQGMFAFAIWDSDVQRLFIARDRLGIKPLYYRFSPECFLFASEIKALFAYPGLRPSFCRSVLPEYLAFGYLSGEETFYNGINKLMPGHWLEIDRQGKLNVQQYWDVNFDHGQNDRGDAYYINVYRDLIENAVKSHLVSDVPIGVFLSGGLDSSAVAALATRARGGPLETFSVGYSEEKYSELPYARLVSQHLKSVHHEVLVSQEELFETLPKLIWHEDEPIVWPSSVALYFVAQAAKDHVKVVLTGEGSDETLAGYTRYAFTLKNVAWDRAYRRMVPEFGRKSIRKLILDSLLLSAKDRRKWSHSFLARDGQSWPSFYFDNFFSAFNEAQQSELFHSSIVAEFPTGSGYRHVLRYWDHSSGEMLRRLLYTDIKTYLVELLMKQDNMSMAASIESRVPFLDHKLVEFAMEIPASVQISGLTGKRILRKAVQSILPDAILRRKKLGFPTPWGGWLAGPQLDAIEALLLEPRSIERNLFRPAAVKTIFHQHRSGARDHGDRIWRLLNFELWCRVCLEGESSPTQTEEIVTGLGTTLH